MIDPNLLCLKCMSILPAEGAPCPVCGSVNAALSNSPEQLGVESILAGKYLVGCSLGQGGFGITYVGWDLKLDTKLAIKEYYPKDFARRGRTGQPTVVPYSETQSAFFHNGREKFIEEARALARFRSDPIIVNVYDFFNENGTSYIVMDFVEGRTLKKLVDERGGRLPASEALGYLYPVMESLSRVHASGLLHRDISPDNIIIRPDGSPVLLDFGAARQISVVGEHSNTIMLKHGYAPEEQYRTHGKQGPWTDVYAISATIYCLATGKLPPSALDRNAPGGDALTPIDRFPTDLTDRQKRAITKGLSVWGQDRQQSMAELLDGLREPVYPSPPPPPPSPTFSRAIVGVVAAIVCLAGVALLLRLGRGGTRIEAAAETSVVTSSPTQKKAEAPKKTAVPATHVPNTEPPITVTVAPKTSEPHGTVEQETETPAQPPRTVTRGDDWAIAISAYNAGQYGVAIPIMEEYAAREDGYAQFLLSLYYHDIKKEYSKAYDWAYRSANNGDSDGQYYLGDLYRWGKGTGKDYDQAFYWYGMSAAQGNWRGLLNLGYCYHKGIGVEKDLYEALRLYELAARAPNANSMPAKRIAEVQQELGAG